MRLALLLASVALFSVIDYLATVRAIAHGVVELNPVMDPLIGTPWFPLIKLAIIPGALYAVWLVRDRWQNNRGIYLGIIALATAYGTLTMWHVWGQLRL